MIIGNMRVTVEKEFASAEEAASWLRAVEGIEVKRLVPASSAAPAPSEQQSTASPQEAPGNAPATAPAAAAETPVKKPRKPRADAGQPRGPYKTTGEPAASEPAAGSGDSAPASTTAAPATPTNNDAYHAEIEARNAAARASVKTAAPTETITPAQSAPSAAAAPAKLTHDDMRAHLGRINKVSGLGMAACQQFLADYRTLDGAPVKRISDVPEAEFPRFIEMVDRRIARFGTEGK